MAYVLYGGGPLPAGLTAAGAALTPGTRFHVWLDPAGQRPAEARLRTLEGEPVGFLTLPGYSRCPLFQGPAGLPLYASVPGSPTVPVPPRTALGGGPLGSDQRVDGPLEVTGDLVVGSGTAAPSVTVRSSFAGGDDDAQPGHYDSTGRINLYSYQRALRRHWGETVRHYLMRKDAKAMTAWYGPRRLYDSARRAVGDPADPDDFHAWVWTGAHYEANDHDGIHGHWEVEVPDTTGALRGRLEILFADQRTGAIGLDITKILTNLAHFVVRCSNGQQLRLQAVDGNELPIVFTRDVDGGWGRRWKLRTTAAHETGAGAGSDFELCRYDDTGTMVDQPFTVTRATGRVAVGGQSGSAGGLVVRRREGVALEVVGSATVDGVPVTPALFARKTADQARPGAAAAAADPELTVPVAAGATYLLDAMLVYTGDAGGGLRFGFEAPAGGSCAWSAGGPAAATAAPLRTSGTEAVGAAGAGTKLVVRPAGLVRTGEKAGAVALRWAQSAGGPVATTLCADSWLRLTKVG